MDDKKVMEALDYSNLTLEVIAQRCEVHIDQLHHYTIHSNPAVFNQGQKKRILQRVAYRKPRDESKITRYRSEVPVDIMQYFAKRQDCASSAMVADAIKTSGALTRTHLANMESRGVLKKRQCSCSHGRRKNSRKNVNCYRLSEEL